MGSRTSLALYCLLRETTVSVRTTDEISKSAQVDTIGRTVCLPCAPKTWGIVYGDFLWAAQGV